MLRGDVTLPTATDSMSQITDDFYAPGDLAPDVRAEPTLEEERQTRFDVADVGYTGRLTTKPQTGKISGGSLSRFKMYPSLRVGPKTEMYQRLRIIPSSERPEMAQDYDYGPLQDVADSRVFVQAENPLKGGPIYLNPALNRIRKFLAGDFGARGKVELSGFDQVPVGGTATATQNGQVNVNRNNDGFLTNSIQNVQENVVTITKAQYDAQVAQINADQVEMDQYEKQREFGSILQFGLLALSGILALGLMGRKRGGE